MIDAVSREGSVANSTPLMVSLYHDCSACHALPSPVHPLAVITDGEPSEPRETMRNVLAAAMRDCQSAGLRKALAVSFAQVRTLRRRLFIRLVRAPLRALRSQFWFCIAPTTTVPSPLFYVQGGRG